MEWQTQHADKIRSAPSAIELIRPGNNVFIGTGCAAPQHLVDALVEHGDHIHDAHITHLLTMGDTPYADGPHAKRFRMNTFFVADNTRESIARGIGDYTPIYLSDIPRDIEMGRFTVDVALISVTPPDARGLCSLGVSVDIVKAAALNARYVIAQVNADMPRTFGDSFLHVNQIDVLVPHDAPLPVTPPLRMTDALRKIGENVARLVEDGSTIECGIGRVPQAVAEFLRDKKDLGIHTEMFGDWIIDLVESGAVTCAKKNVNRGKVVASFCLGSKRLYDYIDNNPLFEFYPTGYVNDPQVISQNDKMVAINVGLEIDLTGQVCADSLGTQLYSGFGGQVDFMRGAARSKGGKAIIALPSTAKKGAVSRIVPTLSEGAGVVTNRADIQYVVTEYGMAYLHGKSIRERAIALISIAHPKFRKQLLAEAKERGFVYADQIEVGFDELAYPQQIEQHVTLHDGTEIFVRPVKPIDDEPLTEMLYSLSEKSVRRRFFTHTKAFPLKDVQHLTNIDYEQNLALVGIVPGPGEGEIVAIAQYFLNPAEMTAEIAFIVQDDWQAKGVGTRMMQALGQVAVERGVHRFDATVLPENKAMLALFQNSGYPVRTEFDGDSYAVEIELKT